jgi:hypothetical protein
MDDESLGSHYVKVTVTNFCNDMQSASHATLQVCSSHSSDLHGNDGEEAPRNP